MQHKKEMHFMKRVLSLILSAAFVLSLTSCTKTDNSQKQETGTKNDSTKVEAVGGWVEQEITPPEGKRSFTAPYLLADGTLWYFTQEVIDGSPVEGKQMVKHISTDNGVTWKSEPTTWADTTGGEIPLGIDVSKNGTVIMQSFHGKDEPRRLWICKKDGTPEELVFEGYTVKNGLGQLLFLDENNVLLVSAGMAPISIDIFDINTKKKVGSVENKDDTMGILFCPASYDGKLYFANYNEDGVSLNEILPDGTLNEGLTKLIDFNYGSASMDAEGNYYFLTKQGISRVVKGGSITETIVEGATFAITSPENYTSGICIAADGSIIASTMPNSNSNEEANKITKSTLYRYYYDENLPAPTGDTLRVWSLRDNLTVRGAIVHFAKAMPDVAVNLEIALSDGDVLPQDALRNLNTELLSGIGPDIIIFDDADYEQYIQKGLLEDLAPVLKDVPFAQNLISPFYKDNKAYVVPARFAVPILFGPKEDVESFTSLSALQSKILSLPKRADVNYADEEYYKELTENEKYALSFKSITELTDFVLQSSMPAIISNNKIDENALQEAYSFIKAVSDYYDLSNYRAKQEDNGIEISGSGDIASLVLNDGSLEYSQVFRARFGREIMYVPSMYAELSDEKNETHVMIGQPGLVSGAYLPKTLLGINANSAKKDVALEFIKVVFGNEVQNTFYGFDAFRGDGMSVLEPTLTSMVEKVFKEKKKQPFKLQTDAIFTALKTPVIISEALREKILVHTTALCKGEETMEKAIDGTVKDLELYLAERE